MCMYSCMHECIINFKRYIEDVAAMAATKWKAKTASDSRLICFCNEEEDELNLGKDYCVGVEIADANTTWIVGRSRCLKIAKNKGVLFASAFQLPLV